MIQRCENSQSRSSECSGLLNTSLFSSMYPDSFEQTLGCLGTARFSGNSVRITPIGLNVIKLWSLSLCSDSIDRVADRLFF